MAGNCSQAILACAMCRGRHCPPFVVLPKWRAVRVIVEDRLLVRLRRLWTRNMGGAHLLLRQSHLVKLEKQLRNVPP